MASVIIPAHNEALVIERCLRSLLHCADEDEFDVIVVCNGCNDDTAMRARRFPGVRVLEIEAASKPAALNSGDAATQVFPRLYVDADVCLDAASARKVAAALRDGPLLAASPEPKFDLTGASRWIRMYYRILRHSDYIREGMSGASVYALSEEGRARFTDFPDIIADDTYIRSRFNKGERGAVSGAMSVVQPARSVAAFLARSQRAAAGNLQLASFLNERSNASTAGSGRYLHVVLRALRDPRDWLSLPVYVILQARIRQLGRQKVRRGTLDVWDRDLSSRSAGTAD